MQKKFLSIAQAAEISSLSTRFLYESCQKRELKFYRCGRRMVIDSQDLQEFITREAVEPVEDWGEKLGLK